MKVTRSLFIAIPALVLVSFVAQADNGAPRPAPQQQQQQQQPPQQQYPPQQEYYQGGGGGYYQQGYPQQGYFCGNPCMPPPPLIVMPVPVPIPMPGPAILPPIPPISPYCPPNCGGGWNGGGRFPPPVWGGGGGRVPPPVYVAPGGTGGYIGRRMSGTVGCEIQRGNNGEVTVLSAGGAVIYANSSERAEENAEIMKTYYENGNTGLCGAANAADKVHSI